MIWNLSFNKKKKFQNAKFNNMKKNYNKLKTVWIKLIYNTMKKKRNIVNFNKKKNTCIRNFKNVNLILKTWIKSTASKKSMLKIWKTK